MGGEHGLHRQTLVAEAWPSSTAAMRANARTRSSHTRQHVLPSRTCSTPQVGEQHRHDLSSMRHEIVGLVFPAHSAALRDGGRLLTAHPASTGARFRLLHLVLRYCQAQQAAARGKPCPLPIVLLYEQVGGWRDDGAGGLGCLHCMCGNVLQSA